MFLFKAYHFLIKKPGRRWENYYDCFLRTEQVMDFIHRSRGAGNLVKVLDCDLFMDDAFPEWCIFDYLEDDF